MHFYRNDIPAMHIFTGLHPHFHSPADDVENLNFEGIDKIGDFVYALSSGLALAEIDFMHAEAASQDDYVFGETTLHNRPTGIYTSFKVREEGVELLDIVRQSRAWQAGLRPGDVITKVNGKNVNSTTALRYNIRDIVSRLTAENLRAGVPIDMTIERNGEEMSVQVEL
jgi:C-terminal processing protease CtpA/Prc